MRFLVALSLRVSCSDGERVIVSSSIRNLGTALIISKPVLVPLRPPLLFFLILGRFMVENSKDYVRLWVTPIVLCILEEWGDLRVMGESSSLGSRTGEWTIFLRWGLRVSCFNFVSFERKAVEYILIFLFYSFFFFSTSVLDLEETEKLPSPSPIFEKCKSWFFLYLLFPLFNRPLGILLASTAFSFCLGIRLIISDLNEPSFYDTQFYWVFI